MNQLLDEIQRAIKNTVLDNSVGVAFSGGVDSTLIAKLLHDNGYDIHLLTIGFHDSHDICLLYTSPSPRDLSTSRMPSSA